MDLGNRPNSSRPGRFEVWPNVCSPKMKGPILVLLLCLLFAVSCTPPKASAFLAAFNPNPLLNTIGSADGVTYTQRSGEVSSSSALLGGAQFHKEWSFSFSGSHVQLTNQLDRFKAEVERQILLAGGRISGRGTRSGDLSGFSFDYSCGNQVGFLRMTGASFDSGRQVFEVIVYEH